MTRRKIVLLSHLRKSVRHAPAAGWGVVASGAGVIANPRAGLTRAQAVETLGPDVTPHMVSMWVIRGWLDHNGDRRQVRVVGRHGRARLYAAEDLIAAEKDTRRSSYSHRAA